MDCPVCRRPMIVFELDKVELDNCASCGGIWLDKGELELLLESSEKKDKFLSSFEAANRGRERKMICPICLKKMQKASCGIESEILIDRCFKGDGIWLDKGELEKILKMAGSYADSRILNFLKAVFGAKKV